MNKKIIVLSFCIAGIYLAGCKKNTSTPASTMSTSAATVLSSETNVVLFPVYAKMYKDCNSLDSGAVAFQSSPSSTNLSNCRQLWLNATADYEVSSASEFGPNGAIGADPASLINTFPIDTFGINSLISGPATFTAGFIDSLPSYLIGFHGIEFVLYGANGDKTAAEFNPRQLAYIAAVAQNIKNITWSMDSNWSPSYSNAGNYYYQFVDAGNGSMVYLDQRAAFSDMVMAIANICETDCIYKMNAILANKSTILQESPFANNSLADISNNLAGVQQIYYGQYGGVQGAGLSAFVKQSNVNLDNELKTDISNAMTAVNKITVPLSQAIYSQPTQVNVAINACDSLDDDLKTSLLLYMNANTN